MYNMFISHLYRICIMNMIFSQRVGCPADLDCFLYFVYCFLIYNVISYLYHNYIICISYLCHIYIILILYLYFICIILMSYLYNKYDIWPKGWNPGQSCMFLVFFLFFLFIIYHIISYYIIFVSYLSHLYTIFILLLSHIYMIFVLSLYHK